MSGKFDAKTKAAFEAWAEVNNYENKLRKDGKVWGSLFRALKAQGFTILLVEQNFRFASTLADRYYIMEHGRVVEQFANAELEANLGKLHEYLGV